MKDKDSEKICCIIGGTSGLGQAIALGFAEEGYRVVVSSRNKDKIKAANARLNAVQKYPLIVKSCDVKSEKSLISLKEKILNTYGKIDVLVVAAGIHKRKEALLLSVKEWEEVIKTNLTGTFIANKVFGEYFCFRKKGVIINIGSLSSFVALTQTSAYNISKAGVVALTKSLAVEWAKYNVRVNAIIPGVFPTELNKKALSDKKRKNSILRNTPMKRFGKPEEIVSAALFLADERSSFITGETVAVDGGFLAWSGF